MLGLQHWLWVLGVTLLGFATPAAPAKAQDLRSPILTIDSEQLFAQSAFGQRVESDFAADGALLEAENRRIEAQLQQEEQGLTAQRAELNPEAFRNLADAFDKKVQQIRTEQSAKLQALTQRAESDRSRFLAQITPVLKSIMVDTGAAVIVERRSVFMSANAIDVTQAAIQRIDAEIGDGSVQSPSQD